jgi:tagatose-1,6-bisphosphate aldolase non-catalytic subunit AgaZ/GatZ
MKKETALTTAETDLLVDLTFHNIPASLLSEFAEKIVRPYYNGNLNAAVQDLILEALSEQ